MPGRLHRDPPKFHRFWRESIDQLDQADLAGARRILTDALREFEAALLLQSTAVSGHAQLIYQMLADVIRQAGGVGDMGILSGAGGAEMAVITDIWRASARRDHDRPGRPRARVPRPARGRGVEHRLARGLLASAADDRRVRRSARTREGARPRCVAELPAAQAGGARGRPRVQAPRRQVRPEHGGRSACRCAASPSAPSPVLDVTRACARRIGD